MNLISASSQIVSGAYDSAGNFFPLDSCHQKINKDAGGNVTSIEATYGTDVWVQTYTYNVNDTQISQWVKQ